MRAVVCEVCNTFGENHCYLLAHDDGRPLRRCEEMVARQEFHVSPFLKIEGSYRFRFVFARGRCVARVDYDDASGPLLLTSIYGSFSKLSDRLLLRTFFVIPCSHSASSLAFIGRWRNLGPSVFHSFQSPLPRRSRSADDDPFLFFGFVDGAAARHECATQGAAGPEAAAENVGGQSNLPLPAHNCPTGIMPNVLICV